MRITIVFAFGLLLALPVEAQKRRAVRHSAPPMVAQQTVVLTPAKDNTLYDSGSGSLSNGSGPHMFAGNTASGARRRPVAFDLRQIPVGSRVIHVTLKMTVSMSASAQGGVALHALLADWGEGASNAGTANDGGGAPAMTNDATWIHRFFPGQRWASPGGDFSTAPDAPSVPASSGATWETAEMVSRVQQWVDEPATNFGWMVIGDESASRTAKRFDSREATGATKP